MSEEQEYEGDQDVPFLVGQGVGREEAALFVDQMRSYLLTLQSSYMEDFAFLAELCQSPIEVRMLTGLLFMRPTFGTPAYAVAINRTVPKVSVHPQHPIRGYKVDFAVHVDSMMPGPPIKVVIECDGHEFHDKTKEQAARDKRRDRDLAAAGYTVLRFTGSEIWRDLEACIESVTQVIDEREFALIDARERA